MSVKSIAFLEETPTPELVPEPSQNMAPASSCVSSPVDAQHKEDMSLLDEAHEQLLEAFAKRDAEMAKVEELTRQNAELRRLLAKQSQGLLLMDADNSAGEAQHLASFVQTVRAQLQDDLDDVGADDIHVSFPELEAELKEASAESAETLTAVRAALEKLQLGSSSSADLQALQELQQKSLSCQSRKRDLEERLLEASTKHLRGAVGGAGGADGAEEHTDPRSARASARASARHMRGVTMATIQLLTEAGPAPGLPLKP